MGIYCSFMCSRTTLAEAQKKNAEALAYNGFRIAICPDWRGTSSGNPKYITPILQYWRDIVEAHGGKLVVLGFHDTPAEWKDKIHGLIIPGGRDIDPRFYGQENTDSKFDAVDAELRWNFCSKFLKECNGLMPIFGVCYGFQVINCILGGSMIQSIPVKRSHTWKTRNGRVKAGSELEQATSKSLLEMRCYHHQCLDRLAPGIEPIAWDNSDEQVHAYVYKGTKENPRDILCVLWHPEAVYSGQYIDQHHMDNLAIVAYFLKKADQYCIKNSGPTAKSNFRLFKNPEGPKSTENGYQPLK
jgi:putative glutamine amidotransferase